MITVRVPATSANLGAGYDAIGVALEFYNLFRVMAFLEEGKYVIDTVGAGGAASSVPENNILITSYEKACRQWGIASPGLNLVSLNAIPFCRGLGSSSSAIVGGVLIANEMRAEPLPKEDLLPLIVSLEGHPDNVVPCCLGGFVVSCWDGSDLRYSKIPSGYSDITAVVAVPDVRVSTEKARSVLPKEVPMADAVFNVGRSALLAASWATGNWENLSWAMGDKLHQPFRSKLFPGGERILNKLRDLPECGGVAISGSGPTMIAFTKEKPQVVAKAMCGIFSEEGVHSRFFILDVNEEGATVINNSENKREVRSSD